MYVGKYKKLGWVGRVSDISGVMIQASRVIGPQDGSGHTCTDSTASLLHTAAFQRCYFFSANRRPELVQPKSDWLTAFSNYIVFRFPIWVVGSVLICTLFHLNWSPHLGLNFQTDINLITKVHWIFLNSCGGWRWTIYQKRGKMAIHHVRRRRAAPSSSSSSSHHHLHLHHHHLYHNKVTEDWRGK